MSESLFSPHWYRVTDLKPHLRDHVEWHRHEYRGLIWYIFEDKSSARNHRFNATAYQVIGLLDGKRSVNHIWEMLNEKLGDYAPTQDEIIQLLGKLHAADLLKSGIPPDTEELIQRKQENKSSKLKQILQNPLSQKFPIWDPEDFLQRNMPRVNWLFRWYYGIIWLVLVLSAAFAATLHWQELTANIVANTLSSYNLIIMGVLYPIIKLLHEFGHAFTTKREGGEVHEMGVIFLAFMPIPYVNVSSSSTFRDKHKRMLVGAAGIAVELFLSALALFLWLSAEPGIIRDIAFNIMLIGSVSSLFFNGNPLLKYDGYYILSDAVGIPNLFQRSTKFLGYLCKKYLFGLTDIPSPATAPGEAAWFVFYSITSFIYRLGVLWVIILFITEKFFVIGIILALWMVTAQILLPILKGVRFIFSSPGLRKQRYRAIGSTVAILGFMLLVAFFAPFPSYTRSEGVVWLPEEAHLRAKTNGFIGQLLATSSSYIEKGTPIVHIQDPFLNAQVEILNAKLKELNTKYRSQWSTDRVQAGIIKAQLTAVKAELKQAITKKRSMLIKSNKAGKLLIPMAADKNGRYIRQGELIGYVIDDSLPTVRVVVTQANIGQVRKYTESVEIRLANHLNQVLPATIIREAPEATNYLPSEALATTGGGKIMINPQQTQELKTLEKIFQLDMEFSPPEKQTPIGTRVYVRFNHGNEPLAYQWYRSIRQVFLSHFNV